MRLNVTKLINLQRLFFILILMLSCFQAIAVNASEAVILWPEGDSATLKTLEPVIKQRYRLISGDQLKKSIETNRCQHRGTFCSRDIAFDYSSSVIVSASKMSNDGEKTIIVEVKNVVTDEIVEKTIKACNDCSREQQSQWDNSLALQVSTLLNGFVEGAPKPSQASHSNTIAKLKTPSSTPVKALSVDIDAASIVAAVSVMPSAKRGAISTQQIKTMWKKYKKIAGQFQQLADQQQYKKIRMTLGKRTKFDQLVEDISKGLMQHHPSTTQLFYGLPLSTTGAREATQKSRDWKYGSDHWSIASDTNLFIAWRHESSYFYVVMNKKRSKDGFAQSIEAGDALVTALK